MKIKMQVKQTNKGLKEGFKEFYNYCGVKNLANKTLKYYEDNYYCFTQFYDETNPIINISKDTINNYILHLKNNTQCNSRSINTRIGAIRTILYYFMDLGYLDRFNIELIKAVTKIKETYTDEELGILLKKPNIKKCEFTEYRDWIIINYLMSTGNRLNTVINIKIKDLDFSSEYILLDTTKNKKQQLIPMSKTMVKILQEYLQFRKGEPQDYLFCSRYGEKLTDNALENSIRKYNLRHGVNKTSIHLFRHTFAKKWILAGGDIFRLQKLLGHSSMDIVRNYVNMFSDDLKIDFDKFNPLEQLKPSHNIIRLKK